MVNYVNGKVIIITGSGGRKGFGSKAAIKLAAMGAKLVISGRHIDTVNETVEIITNNGGCAIGVEADVSRLEDNKRLVQAANDTFGRLDVFVANAGIMPLAFWADAEKAMPNWEQCIDTNYKGVIYGIAASREALAENHCGQFIVLSSIYGNTPVSGAAIYHSTKIAVRYLVETLRQEEFGKIKTTIINPTGVPATSLMKSVVNRKAYNGPMGSHTPEFIQRCIDEKEGRSTPDAANEDSPDCYLLSAESVADTIVEAVNQPAGVSYSEITIRAKNELFTI